MSETEKKIQNLLEAVKKFQNFKQLAKYNIGCILQAITPPTSGWKQAVQYIVHSGGVDILVSILKKQDDSSSEIVVLLTKTLARLNISAESTKIVVESGGIDAAFKTVLGDSSTPSSDAIAETTKLVQSASMWDAESVVRSGGVSGLIKLMEKFSSNQKLLQLSVCTLETLTQTPKGVNELVQQSGIPVMLAAMDIQNSQESSGHLDECFTLLSRACYAPENVEYIAACGGAETIIDTLKGIDVGESGLAKRGGKLLWKLAKGKVKDAIKKLDQGQDPKAIALLSHLAVGEQIENIVNSNGLPNLVAVLQNGKLSNDDLENASRCVAKLIATPDYMKKVMDSGAISVLVKLLYRQGNSDSIITTIVGILTSISKAMSSDIVNKKAKTAEYNSVLFVLGKRVDSEAVCRKCLQYITLLKPFPRILVGAKESVGFISNAMKNHHSCFKIQRHGANALNMLASAYVENSTPLASISEEILKAGGVKCVFQALEDFGESADVAVSCLSILEQINSVNESASVLQYIEIDVQDFRQHIASTAILHLNESGVRATSHKLLDSFVDEACVVTKLQSIEKWLAGITDRPDSESLSLILADMQFLTGCTISAKLSRLLIEHGGISLIFHSMAESGTQMDLDSLNEVLEYCFLFLYNLILSNPSLRDTVAELVQNLGGVSIAAKTMKMNPKMDVAPGLKLLREFSKMTLLSPDLLSNGVAEAMFTLLRVQTEDQTVLLLALSILIDLACYPKNVSALIKKGVFSPVVSTIRPGHSNSNNRYVVHKVLKVVLLLTKNSLGVKALRRIRPLPTLAHVSEYFCAEQDIQRLCGRVISIVASTGDLELACKTLSDIAASDDIDIPQATELMDTVRTFAFEIDNYAQLVDKGVCENVILLMSKLIALEEDVAVSALLSKAAWCIGFMAMEVQIHEASQVGPWMVYILRMDPTKAMLNAVSMFMSSKHNAHQLVNNNLVESLVEIIPDSDVELLPLIFRCLGAIANTSSEFHDRVSSSQALMQSFQRLGHLQNCQDSAPVCAFFDFLSIVCFESPENVAKLHDGGYTPNLLEYIDMEWAVPGKRNFVLYSMKFILTACVYSQNVLRLFDSEFQGGMTFLEIILKYEEYSSDKDIALYILRITEVCHQEGATQDIKPNEMFQERLKSNIVLLLTQHESSETIAEKGGKILALLSSEPKETQNVADLLASIDAAVRQFCGSPEVMLASRLCTFIGSFNSYVAVNEGRQTTETYSDAIVLFHNSLILVGKLEISRCTESIVEKSLGVLSRISKTKRSERRNGSIDISNILQDIMQNYSHNTKILDKSVSLLGALADSNGGLELICKNSCMTGLTKAIRRSKSDNRLQASVTSALSSISKGVAREGGSLIEKQGDGASLVYGVMETVTESEEDLERSINGIVKAPDGPRHLLEIMSVSADNVQLHEKALKQLYTIQEEDQLAFSSPEQIRGVVNAINCASENRSDSNDHYDKRMEEMLNFGINIIERAAQSSANAQSLLEHGGIDALVNTLGNTRNRGTSLMCARALRKMSSHGNAKVHSRFAELQVASTIASALRTHDEDDEFQKDALELLQSINGESTVDSEVGVDGILLFETINLDSNGDFRGETKMLWESKMQSTLEASLLALGGKDVLSFEQARTDEGAVYYVNSKDGSTMWDVPTPIKPMQDYLTSFDALMANMPLSHDYVPLFNPGNLNIFTAHLSSRKGVETCIVLSLKLLLFVLCSDKQQVPKLYDINGHTALLSCLENFSANPAIIALVTKCWNICVAADKAAITALDTHYIGLVVTSLVNHKDHKEMCVGCIKALANATFGSSDRIQSVSDADGISAIETLMQVYRDDADMLSKVLILLANVAHGGNELRVQIADRCGDELILILFDHNDNYQLSMQAIRAVGILAFCEHNIARLIQESATASIIKTCRKHSTKHELVTLSLDVLANLSSDNNDNEYEVIMKEGAPSFVSELLPSVDSESYALSAVNAAANLACHPGSGEVMIEKNYVFAALNLLKEYEWNAEIVETTIDSFNNLSHSNSPAVMGAIVDEGGVQAILSACQIHFEKIELCEAGLTTLSMAIRMKRGIKHLMSVDGASALMKLYEKQKDKTVITMIFKMLSYLGKKDEYAIIVGQACIHQVVSAMKDYEDDLVILKAAISTLTHMTLHDGNLSLIVQQNGVALLVDIICKYPEELDVLEEAIHSIDHIAICSPELCMIVVQESGKEALSLLAETFVGSEIPREERIAQACKHTIMTMGALEHQAQELSKSNFLKCGHKRIVSHESDNGGHVGPSGIDEIQKLRMVEAFDSISGVMMKGKKVYVKFPEGKRSKHHIKMSKEKDALVFVPSKSTRATAVPISIAFVDLESIVRGPIFSEHIQKTKRLHRYLGVGTKSNDEYNLIFSSPTERNNWYEMIRISQKASHIFNSKKDE